MWDERTELLLGAERLQRLREAQAVIVGVGGVGGAAAEMLARASVGHLVLIDNDVVGETNLNRQLPALRSTVGQKKCEVLRDRLLDINPDLDIPILQFFHKFIDEAFFIFRSMGNEHIIRCSCLFCCLIQICRLRRLNQFHPRCGRIRFNSCHKLRSLFT